MKNNNSRNFSVTGNVLPKVILLLLLLGSLAAYLQYEYGTPGLSVIDRIKAKPVVLDLDLLEPNATPASIAQTFHYLRMTCAAEHGSLGDYACWAPVSEFNAIDARIIAFFYRDGHLSAVRISFAPENQPAIFSLLQKRYGTPREFGAHRDSYGNNIVGWIRHSGVVAINDSVGPKQEAILLWISGNKVLTDALGMELPN